MKNAFVIVLFAFASNLSAQVDTLDLATAFLSESIGISLEKSAFPYPNNSHHSCWSLNQQIRQPFFCRIESKWEQKSGKALKFRLGSVDVVNRYEGKVVEFGLDPKL